MWATPCHGLGSQTTQKGESKLCTTICFLLLLGWGNKVTNHLRLLAPCLPLHWWSKVLNCELWTQTPFCLQVLFCHISSHRFEAYNWYKAKLWILLRPRLVSFTFKQMQAFHRRVGFPAVQVAANHAGDLVFDLSGCHAESGARAVLCDLQQSPRPTHCHASWQAGTRAAYLAVFPFLGS